MSTSYRGATASMVNYRDVASTIPSLKPGVLYRSSMCFTPPNEVKTIVDLRRRGAKREDYHQGTAKRVELPFVGTMGGLKLLTALDAMSLARFVMSGGSETVVGEFAVRGKDMGGVWEGK